MFGARRSTIPDYVRRFQSIGLTETERNWRRQSAALAGEQQGVAGALFAGIGEVGRRIIDRDHAKRVEAVTREANAKGLAAGERAAVEGALVRLREDDTLAAAAFNDSLQAGYLASLSNVLTQKGDQIALEHADDPDGFEARWANMSDSILAPLPKEWKAPVRTRIEARRVGFVREIAANTLRKAGAQADATMQAASGRWLAEAENAARAGRHDEAADYLASAKLFLDPRTDLSPQQKETAMADARRSLRRHTVLGEFERIADTGLGKAKAYAENFDERGGIADPDERDGLIAEMRREIGRREREAAEALRAGADEAERLARNGLARIEAGQDPDTTAEARIRDLAGEDAAAAYRHRATRATNRRTAFETLSAMPPGQAWESWRAGEPDPQSAAYADELEDWRAIGKALKQSHEALARDPAAFVAEGVQQEIDAKRAQGGPLAGADDAEIADAMAEAALRRQRELGVRVPRLLTKDQADAIREQWDATGAKDRLALLGSLQARDSKRWPQVLGELLDVGLPPEAGHAAAAENPATARLILEGAEVRKLEPQFVPSNDTVYRDAMNRLLPPEVLEGFSPEFAAGIRETVLSVYGAKAKEAGDVSKLANQERLKEAVDAVTGGIVVYDRPGLGGGNPRALAPVPGMDSEGFTKLIDGISAEDIGDVFTVEGGTVTIDEIRENGEFQAIGGGRYALAIEGVPLFGADGGPATIDLGALARAKGGK